MYEEMVKLNLTSRFPCLQIVENELFRPNIGLWNNDTLLVLMK